MEDNKEREQKKEAGGEIPDATRRNFIKVGITALVLLPYVVPVVQSLTVTAAQAQETRSPPAT